MSSSSSASTTTTDFIGGSHGSVQRRKIPHHPLVLVLLIGMDSLGVLPEVIKSRELFTTVTGEWTFSCVFPIDVLAFLRVILL